MKINIKDCRFYFLTNNNDKRKRHILNEFSDHNITEVNSCLSENTKNQSFCTGWSRMVDLGSKNQDNTKPFQPFVCLEDDVKKYRDFPEEIDVPDDTDILYIGLSQHGCTNKLTNQIRFLSFTNINSDIIRIYNMLASHGIVICSTTGALAIQKSLLEGYFKNRDCDLFMASLQPYYNVYALRRPLVYQYGDIGGEEMATKFEIHQENNTISPELIKNDTVGLKCCYL